jgi:DNA (cytosine-5)-methyltransferase 1
MTSMGKYKLLDLFCGAGGLSLGFERAGFSIVKAIDIDKWAIETYNYNRKEKVAEVKDVSSVDKDFIKSIGSVDGIIGGPPCQGFSTSGQRLIDDERNKLYREYFRVLEEVNPKFFVIENVTGLLTFAKGAVKNDIIRRANALGYKVFLDTLDTSKFGIPQIRLRIIFIGIKKELCNKDFVFPVGNKKPITILDAIDDLPSLDNGEDNTKYNKPPRTEYERIIRDGMTELHNHILSKHTEDTKKTISLVPEGGSIMDVPLELRGGRNYHALLRKMDRNKPALCIDTGHRTYFHYEEKRIPSTREVARLQSFPDSFVFIGPRNDQQKQVGNAVPPLLAEAIAKQIIKYLK